MLLSNKEAFFLKVAAFKGLTQKTFVETNDLNN